LGKCDLYNTAGMAAGYANSRPAVHPRIIEMVRQRLRLTRRLNRALDVGCGAGLSTRPLERIARHCIGVDPSEAMLGWSAAVAPNACFAVGAAEALPVRSHSIDLITAAGSLNYADLSLFFPEAVRALAPEGVLVIYDFSEGRNFRGPASLDAWYSEFLRRYPRPSGSGREISPESLGTPGSGFRLSGHEYFEIGLRLNPDFYLDYVMTETNVAQAVGSGIAEQEIRAWCAGTLAPVFQGEAREVLFRGYAAWLVVA
jgi:SAM-dependent methyltransferase